MLRFLAPVILFSLLTSQVALACQVPVCDIAATIQDLRTKSVDDRSAFYSDLYQTHLNSRDGATLRNLREFGAQAYNLSIELNDTKPTVKWAADVRQIGQGLLIYADFHKDEFIATYIESASIPELSRASQQRVRFSALFRWKTEIPLMFNVQKIYEVYEYIHKASDLSRELNDEDYIIREAQMALELLSARISYLYPVYEGVYAVNTKCSATGECSDNDVQSDRLVVMNSLTDYDVVASLTVAKEANLASAVGDNSHGLNFLFIKSLVKNNGTSLYSKSDVLYIGERPSEIQTSFTANQDVSGSAVTSRYTGALNFAGSVVFSPLKFYTDEIPALAGNQPISGEFSGQLGNEKLRLIIRQRADKTLMATAFIGDFDSGEARKIDFSMGQFVAHRQLINLTGVGMLRFSPYKMLVAYRLGADNKIRWSGGFYSTTGYFTEVSFNYVGPVVGL